MLDIKFTNVTGWVGTCSTTTLLLSDYFWEVSSKDTKRQELTLVEHKYQLLSRQMWSHYNTLFSSPEVSVNQSSTTPRTPQAYIQLHHQEIMTDGIKCFTQVDQYGCHRLAFVQLNLPCHPLLLVKRHVLISLDGNQLTLLITGW